MIYANQEIKKREKEMDWGTLTYFSLGERGRGRREISLPTNIKEEKIKSGLNAELTIGFTKNGNPRVNHGHDNSLYLLLSSEYGYTRRGDGIIYMPKVHANEIDILAVGNGADGDAGRIGSWDCGLYKAPADRDIMFRVKMAGGAASVYYLLHENAVYKGNASEILQTCDMLDIECPAPIYQNKDGDYVTDTDYWVYADKIQKAKEYASDEERIADMLAKYPEIHRYIDVHNMPEKVRISHIKNQLKNYSRWMDDSNTVDELSSLVKNNKELFYNNPDIQKSFCEFLNQREFLRCLNLYKKEPEIVDLINAIPDDIVGSLFEENPPSKQNPYLTKILCDIQDHPALFVQRAYIEIEGADFSKAKDFIEQLKDFSYEEKLEIYKKNNELVGLVGFSEEALCEILEKKPYLLRRIENPTDKMIEISLTARPTNINNPSVLDSIPEGRLTPELLLRAVKEDDYTTYWYAGDLPNSTNAANCHLSKIKHPTREIQEWIAQNHPLYISALHELPDDILCMALEKIQEKYKDKGLNSAISEFVKTEKTALNVIDHGLYHYPEVTFSEKLTSQFSPETMIKLYEIQGGNLSKNQMLQLLTEEGVEAIPDEILLKMYHWQEKDNRDGIWKESPLIDDITLINDGKCSERILEDILRTEISNFRNDNMDEFITKMDNTYPGEKYFFKGKDSILRPEVLAKVMCRVIENKENERLKTENIKKLLRKLNPQEPSITSDPSYYEKTALACIKRWPEMIGELQYFCDLWAPKGMSKEFIDEALKAVKNSQLTIDITEAEKHNMPKEMLDELKKMPNKTFVYSFDVWNRNSGATNLSYSYVIGKDGENIPFTSFTWKNTNHRFHTSQEHADGTRHFKDMPLDSVAVFMTKDYTRDSCHYHIFHAPEYISQKQMEKLWEIQEFLHKEYPDAVHEDGWTASLEVLELEEPDRGSGSGEDSGGGSGGTNSHVYSDNRCELYKNTGLEKGELEDIDEPELASDKEKEREIDEKEIK